jgi:hypothetical protein
VHRTRKLPETSGNFRADDPPWYVTLRGTQGYRRDQTRKLPKLPETSAAMIPRLPCSTGPPKATGRQFRWVGTTPVLRGATERSGPNGRKSQTYAWRCLATMVASVDFRRARSGSTEPGGIGRTAQGGASAQRRQRKTVGVRGTLRLVCSTGGSPASILLGVELRFNSCLAGLVCSRKSLGGRLRRRSSSLHAVAALGQRLIQHGYSREALDCGIANRPRVESWGEPAGRQGLIGSGRRWHA